jgi:hypothetical protein
MLPQHDNGSGQRFGIGHFSILFEDPVQVLLPVTAEDVRCLQRLPFVHAHIQIRLHPDGKTTVRFIELVTAYAEIGQYAVYGADVIQTQKALQVPEIVRDEMKSFIGQSIFFGIRILIECVQPAFGIQVRQDLRRMAASAKGAIHVDPVRPDIQTVHRF